MMTQMDITKYLDFGKGYTRKELFSKFFKINPRLKDGSFNWEIGKMINNGMLVKDGYNNYQLPTENKVDKYEPYYSDSAKEIMNYLSLNYPYLKFVIFETALLNEFLNHLIAQNTIIVYVEKESSSYIFRDLQGQNKFNVLYKPSDKEKNLYWSKNCVIVADLISEAPLSKTDSHIITLEKMLVDLYCDKYISGFYSFSEYPEIMQQILERYMLDKKRMLRYARRRGKENNIKEVIKEITKGE